MAVKRTITFANGNPAALFTRLMEESSHLDLRIACKDGELHAHRLIIAAAAPLLRDLFIDSPSADGIVLPDFTMEVVQKWLNGVYTMYTVDWESNVKELQDLFRWPDQGYDIRKRKKKKRRKKNDVDDDDKVRYVEYGSHVHVKLGRQEPEVDATLTCGKTQGNKRDVGLEKEHEKTSVIEESKCQKLQGGGKRWEEKGEGVSERVIEALPCRLEGHLEETSTHKNVNENVSDIEGQEQDKNITKEASPGITIVDLTDDMETEMESEQVPGPELSPEIIICDPSPSCKPSVDMSATSVGKFKELLLQAKPSAAPMLPTRQKPMNVNSAGPSLTNKDKSKSSGHPASALVQIPAITFSNTSQAAPNFPIRKQRARWHKDHPTFNRMGLKLTCLICWQRFGSNAELQLHKETHGRRPIYCCHLCSKQTTSEQVYRRHVAMHVEGEDCRCSICDKKFQSVSELKSHIPIHLTNNLDVLI